MLRRLADAAAERPQVRVQVWFLRCAWYQDIWPHSMLIDSLRTWWPSALMQRLGLDRVAGRLQGLRLRVWLRRVAADIVILDDGLGERLLTHHPGHPVMVHRRNREPTSEATQEAPPLLVPDAELIRPGMRPDQRSGVESVLEYETRNDWEEARRIGEPSVRHAARHRLGLPTDQPLITGWGDSGWVDGPDLFVRVLWVLQNRSGIEAHGAWFGSDEDPHEVARLRADADRCGVGDRYHYLCSETPYDRLCGDLVFLPYRDEADPEELLVAICSGQAVVTFPVTTLDQEAIHLVDHLDLEAAGSRLADLLKEDREARWSSTLRTLDVQSLVDELIGLVQSRHAGT